MGSVLSAEMIREAVYDAHTGSICLARLQGTRQARDSYTVLRATNLSRTRRFASFNMHAKPEGFSDSPRYNTILARGVCAADGPWQTLAFQMVGCTWRCWYCYVDSRLLKGNPAAGEFIKIKAMADDAIAEEQSDVIVDLTGGQPDLVPEWPLRLLERLRSFPSGASIAVRSEDNLSNDFLWRFVDESGRRRLAEDPRYTRVGCLKGFDRSSFADATAADGAGFDRQMGLVARLSAEGFEPFYYASFTPRTNEELARRLEAFFDALRRIWEPLPLRVVPLSIRQVETWPPRASKTRRKDLERESHMRWFDLLQRTFGNKAFTTELRDTL